ncbi:TlpA disulfide reductase family protein [Pseudomonas panipatensis]|uniref:Thiol-disulfide isomerase or thioredoxin n=1 Tax=Pseudomonas panipatensis TaxID=428992 RepID=A0A1G8GQA9_9PSED|nr:TlpA disulfide reductase family protein [Pseudomonas panipatensis]SDH96523.1 Thiol-disulfide isomerase or thioredoxin [Pseudomonas panipatensis]SMP41994.1 Thiol-disulfide isomerase or thioredoxin [Pseudomonas panipatensis]
MGVRLRIISGFFVGLILAGCSADYGVDQYGRKVPAASLDGQWLVINYWADWCAPCRKEVPEFNRLSKDSEGKGVRVLGVNYDGLRDAELASAAHGLDIQYLVLADDPAQRFELPRSDVLPVTFIVDAQGRLRERLVGEQTASGVQARLLALQEEKR